MRQRILADIGTLGNVSNHQFALEAVDDLHFVAYHSAMTHDETDNPQNDPLTVGELITLQEAAEYSGLTRDSIHGYIKRGRLKAKKKGWMWFTTRAAVDAYLQSRDLESIPKKYRNRS